MKTYDVWYDDNDTFTSIIAREPVATFEAATPEYAAIMASQDSTFDKWTCKEFIDQFFLIVREQGTDEVCVLCMKPRKMFEVTSIDVIPIAELDR